MAVYDRWHKSGPGEPCRQHRGAGVPSAAHGRGVRWQVRWYDDKGRQPKKNFRLKEGKNPDLHADAFWAKIQRDLDTGTYTDPDSANITFAEYAGQWRLSRTHDDVTAVKMERNFRLHVLPVIGGRSLRELSRRPSLIQAWIKTLEHLAPRTSRQIVTDVSGVFLAAANDGLIAVNPARASSVRRPALPQARPRAWTREQVAAVAAALQPRYRVIPAIGAGAGLRQGEVLGLAVEDIAFLGRDPHLSVVRQVKHVRGVICFAPPKRRKTRTVPLAPELARALARHLELFPAVAVTLPWHDPADRARHGRPFTARLVITDKHSRDVNRNTFGKCFWNPARDAAGLAPERENGMHALRHTYVSVQLGAGSDVLSVAQWTGDTPQVIWQTYAHFMPGREGGGRAAVSAFFAAQGAPDMPPGQSSRALPQLSGVTAKNMG